MSKGAKTAVRQLILFVASTVLAFTVLVRTEVVSRFAYLLEKGRLRAVRESLPTATELEKSNIRTRAVAAAVAPGVVQIIAERQFDLTESLKKQGRGEPLDTDSSGADSGDASTNALTMPDDPIHRRLRENPQLRIRDGYGSGFVFDAERGYIVTNSHVIDSADAIRVQLADGRRYDAVVVGADRKSDLAVIKIEADNLHALPLADSDTVEVGDDVMAVGNPFGLDGTFSRGIISAKRRSSIDIHGIEYKGFLQTDAVINPGNSGGPLVNMRAEVIAINTAIATESGHYDGVGFAIPSRRVMQLLPVLARGDEVVRGYLGVSIVSATDAEDKCRTLGWTGFYGVIVRDVLPESPAQASDLRKDDIILAVDGERLRNTADLIDHVGESAPDSAVAMRIWRDGSEIAIQVILGRQPADFTTRVPLPPADSR